MLYWLYRSTYYRLYRYSEKVDGRRSGHHLSAATSFSMLLISNFATICVVYALIPGTKSLVPGSLPVWAYGAAAVLFAFAHAVFISYKGRYKKIVAEFSQENREEQHRRNIWTAWYAILSVSSWMILVIVGTSLGWGHPM